MTLLVDSSIVIGHLRGEETCAAALKAYLRAGADLAVSAVTWTEVLAGERQDAQAESIALALLESFTTEPVTAAIATAAGRLVRAWRRSHGLRLPDAVIAATALELDCPLVTLDQRHFACVPGLVIAAVGA
ncbi:MAG TPA: type II toxin-antitoxin system VapC family toxin [Bacillota bacterium]|nr:type II toxin-antitoxin system VapC family toxin [Bacillota bacterium]